MEVDARSVIHFQLVRDPSELDRGRSVKQRFAYSPEFVHQIFQDEKIKGHESPLLTMHFAAHSLYLLGPDFVSIRQSSDADDVLGALEAFLPNQPDFATLDQDVFIKKLKEPFAPLGKLIASYECVEAPDTDPVPFFIRKADFAMKGVRKLHERLRFHATCFIENASFIDDSDDKWSLLLLYRQRQPSESVNASKFVDICGYVTVYSFYAHPGGERHRLSQIIVFPPYQRQGHGRRLLQAVYDNAIECGCFEVTVEDPAPAFQRLRDVLDLQRIVGAGFFARSDSSDVSKSPGTRRKRQRTSSFPNALEKWDARYAKDIREQLKIPISQIRRLYEMLKLHELRSNDDEQAWTDYRLEVKRRLQREVLGGVRRSVEDRKKILADLYDDTIKEYDHVLASVEQI
ncbi:histone acetyltransferase [Plasmodiophora brassicae]